MENFKKLDMQKHVRTTLHSNTGEIKMITQKQYDELKAERDALAAKNWELGHALGLARSGLVSESLNNEQFSVIKRAFETTTQQCLNEIRAKAIEDAATYLSESIPDDSHESVIFKDRHVYISTRYLRAHAAKVQQGGAE